MAEHKHAAVLRAIADGKAVQCRSSVGQWCDPIALTPLTETELEWRIKPEPKPDMRCSGCIVPTAFGFQVAPSKVNLLVTFDGETGKLKSAEVLP